MSDRDGVAVIGAGGHAKAVIAALEASGRVVGGVFDDSPETWGHVVLGHRVVAAPDTRHLAEWRYGVLAIGNNGVRRQLAERIHLEWVTVVHPAAWVHRSVVLGPGTVVFAGAMIQPDTRIGAHVIVNTGATVDHDCRVADFSHLGPGVHLAGGVTVGAGTLLGVGAAVIPGRRVGEWTTIGAGGAVVTDIEDGVTAVGVPAVPQRTRERSE